MYACSKYTILKIKFNSFYILFQIPKWRPNSSDWSCRSHGGGQGTPRWLGCKVSDIAATGTSKTSICSCKIKRKLSSDLAYERWEKSLVFRKGNPRNESYVQRINILKSPNHNDPILNFYVFRRYRHSHKRLQPKLNKPKTLLDTYEYRGWYGKINATRS